LESDSQVPHWFLRGAWEGDVHGDSRPHLGGEVALWESGLAEEGVSVVRELPLPSENPRLHRVQSLQEAGEKDIRGG